jgi:hypothetical protein
VPATSEFPERPSAGIVKSDMRGSLLDTLIDVMWVKQAP